MPAPNTHALTNPRPGKRQSVTETDVTIDKVILKRVDYSVGAGGALSMDVAWDEGFLEGETFVVIERHTHSLQGLDVAEVLSALPASTAIPLGPQIQEAVFSKLTALGLVDAV